MSSPVCALNSPVPVSTRERASCTGSTRVSTVASLVPGPVNNRLRRFRVESQPSNVLQVRAGRSLRRAVSKRKHERKLPGNEPPFLDNATKFPGQGNARETIPRSSTSPSPAETEASKNPADGDKSTATVNSEAPSPSSSSPLVAAAAGSLSLDSSPELKLKIAGEDAAAFSTAQQSVRSWAYFFGVLGVVMGILYVVWISPDTGLGTEYADWFKGISDNPEVQMALMLLVFAIVHSGGAALRPQAEEVIGARAYRVLFAGLSLPLAVSAVVFFINHRYDGDVLWQLRGVPGMHTFVWSLSLLSFFFLYPSTFNLLEVAAVDPPRLHLWGTGIARITRHPQMWGQLIWCLAHSLWVGSSFTISTSLMLCLHHAFGVWHGEKRLKDKYGDKFEEVKERTSIVPFAAILEGRQALPPDYYKEFLRVPYLGVLAFALGAYFVHPLMIRASFYLHW